MFPTDQSNFSTQVQRSRGKRGAAAFSPPPRRDDPRAPSRRKERIGARVRSPPPPGGFCGITNRTRCSRRRSRPPGVEPARTHAGDGCSKAGSRGFGLVDAAGRRARSDRIGSSRGAVLSSHEVDTRTIRRRRGRVASGRLSSKSIRVNRSSSTSSRTKKVFCAPGFCMGKQSDSRESVSKALFSCLPRFPY